MKKSEIFFGLLRIPFDYGMAISAWLLAYKIRPYTDLIPFVHFEFAPEQLPVFPEFIKIVLVSPLILILLFAFGGMYSLKTTFKKIREVRSIVFWVFTWIMFFMAYYFLIAHTLFFSRIVLAHTAFFSIVFIILGRFLIRFIQITCLKLGIGKRNILLIGTSPTAEALVKTLQNNLAYTLSGTLKFNPLKKNFVIPILGPLNDLEKVVKKYGIEEVWLTESTKEERQILEFCQTNHIGFRLIPDMTGLHYSHVEISFLNGLPVLEVKPTPLDGWGKILKRIYDFLMAAFALLIFLPLFVLIGLTIKIDSPGPIFYKSKRVGKKGKIFQMLKFRSMRKDAEKQKEKLLNLSHRNGPLFKIKNDPRTTRIGKFLRKTSLDEVPQLWNVVKGEMSLVGPRPHLPEEVKKYQEHQKRTLTIKPGLTGLAQISGRSDLDFEKEVTLDIAYIENWSVFLDAKIILKTILVILKGKGAD